MKVIVLFCTALFFLACHAQTDPSKTKQEEVMEKTTLIDADKYKIDGRFNPPEDYDRVEVPDGSFASYLRALKLKPLDARVKYFDGTYKSREGIYVSVVDMDIDAVDLQQCADAIMRLRAEYLYEHSRYDDIHFNFLSDGLARYYSEYVQGDYSYEKFRKYMRYIFSYANTRSLHAELQPVLEVMEMKIGDVFIQKGNPYGHAVIIVDMVEHKDSGQKYYLLAQSYMPAQETQILINPMNPEISPWYELNEQSVHTPEWTFEAGDLRRFEKP